MLCHGDYSERVVASFSHQTKSEYYGGNLFVSIDGIALENFSKPKQIEAAVTPQACTRHAVFH